MHLLSSLLFFLQIKTFLFDYHSIFKVLLHEIFKIQGVFGLKAEIFRFTFSLSFIHRPNHLMKVVLFKLLSVQSLFPSYLPNFLEWEEEDSIPFVQLRTRSCCLFLSFMWIATSYRQWLGLLSSYFYRWLFMFPSQESHPSFSQIKLFSLQYLYCLLLQVLRFSIPHLGSLSHRHIIRSFHVQMDRCSITTNCCCKVY